MALSNKSIRVLKKVRNALGGYGAHKEPGVLRILVGEGLVTKINDRIEITQKGMDEVGL